jgi:hypothetical protein
MHPGDILVAQPHTLLVWEFVLFGLMALVIILSGGVISGSIIPVMVMKVFFIV